MRRILELADTYAMRMLHGNFHQIKEARAALQADVERVEALQYRGAPCYKFCEANAFKIEIRGLTAERDALREKLASVERDAARYRFVRQADGFLLDRIADMSTDSTEFDDAIDAAMEATK